MLVVKARAAYKLSVLFCFVFYNSPTLTIMSSLLG